MKNRNSNASLACQQKTHSLVSGVGASYFTLLVFPVGNTKESTAGNRDRDRTLRGTDKTLLLSSSISQRLIFQ
jgi:hypothetical protein